MDRIDATGNGYLGGPEDGVGSGRQFRSDPVFRLLFLEMNHPDLGQLLQQGAERDVLQFLLRSCDSKERHLKTKRKEADGNVSFDPILPGQIHRPDLELVFYKGFCN